MRSHRKVFYTEKSLCAFLIVTIILSSCNFSSSKKDSEKITITSGNNSIQLTLDPPDDGNVSDIEISSTEVGNGQLIVLKDPNDEYLPEIRFIPHNESDQIRVVPKVAATTNSSIHIAHNIDVSNLIVKSVGTKKIENLFSFFQPYFDNGAFGLLIGLENDIAANTEVILYETTLSGVYLVLPADLSISQNIRSSFEAVNFKLAKPNQGLLIGSLVVLTFVVLPALPLIFHIDKQSKPVQIADFTGLTTKDIADLQLLASAQAFGKTGGEGIYGEGVIGKYFTELQAEDIYLYIDSVRIVDKPCNDADFKDKIFSQEPEPGSSIIPLEDDVVIYQCIFEDNDVVDNVEIKTEKPVPTISPTIATEDIYGCTNSNLTPEEKANCGENSYKYTKVITSGPCYFIAENGEKVGRIEREDTITLNFDENGFVPIWFYDDYQNRDNISMNRYAWTSIVPTSSGEIYTNQATIEFFLWGFEMESYEIESDCSWVTTGEILR